MTLERFARPTDLDTILNSVPEDNLATRAGQLGCLQPPTAQRSLIRNRDGGIINFLSGWVLGLPNPLEFEVTAVRWQVRKGGGAINLLLSASKP